MNSNTDCRELMSFQLIAAKSWLQRAKKSKDVYTRFLLYFSGFNALFLLWSKIDHHDSKHDYEQITNLILKFEESTAQHMLDQSKTSLNYFRKRKPVARMIARTCQEPEKYDESYGRKWKQQLDESNQSAVERLVALGQIIYLVRCNLIHGSKVPEDDELTVSKSLKPLKLLLENSIKFTKNCMSKDA